MTDDFAPEPASEPERESDLPERAGEPERESDLPERAGEPEWESDFPEADSPLDDAELDEGIAQFDELSDDEEPPRS